MRLATEYQLLNSAILCFVYTQPPGTKVGGGDRYCTVYYPTVHMGMGVNQKDTFHSTAAIQGKDQHPIS